LPNETEALSSLADQRCHLAAALARALDARLELSHLRLAADEAREASRDRRGQP
jgi:hypothetical protein